LVQSCPRRRAGVAYDERPTDAVGNSCQTLRTTDKRPQIVRTSLKFLPSHAALVGLAWLLVAACGVMSAIGLVPLTISRM
jgi:hypothetical protein